MKKLIMRILLLLAPFIFLALNYKSYEKSDGDLARLGRISVEKKYRDIFINEFLTVKKYMRLSETDTLSYETGNVMIIGDSFSQHKNVSYHNYAANLDSLTYINYDGNINDNPIQAAFGLANGDVFDKMNIRHLVVQSVERDAVLRARNIDRSKIVNIADFKNYISKRPATENAKKSDEGLSIFQDMLKYFVYNTLYYLDDNAFISQVYKARVEKVHFSTKDKVILFYYEDIEAAGPNSQEDGVKKLNNELNALADRLKHKNVKLIFLLCPDKLSLYHPFISDNQRYPETEFYDLLSREKKNYVYIDAFSILRKRIESGEKDIYYADDSHWSPFAAKIIGKELVEMIKEIRSADL